MKLRWLVIVMLVVNALAGGSIVYAAEEGEVEVIEKVAEELTMEEVYRSMVLAASVAFVTAISIVGAAYAVGKIGSAALGAAAEKPELLTRSLLFVALAEGLAVLGFAIAMMLFTKI